MRYRSRTTGSDWLSEFGSYPKEECWDDPDLSRGKVSKPCQMTKITVRSNLRQFYRYYWYHVDQRKWYGPVYVAYGALSTTGPNGFYGSANAGDLPPSAGLPTGFIWDTIRQYGKSDVNIGVFLGELRETVRMFHSPWECALALQRARVPKWIRSLPDAINFVSSQYLGYRYGWRPFMSDVKGFTRLSRRLDERYEADYRKAPRTLKSYRPLTRVSSCVGTNAYVDGPGKQVAWNNHRTVDTMICEYCTVKSNPSAAALGIANKFAQFYRLADVATIAWELVPMSFIVDWFIPIGDFIEDNLSAPANLVAASGPWRWVSTKEVYKVSNYGLASSLYRTEVQFGYEIERHSFARDCLAAFPPKPSEIDGWQKLDLALIAGQKLRQLFGKSFRR